MRTYAIRPTRLNRGEKGAWTVEWRGPHHGRIVGQSVVVSKYEDEGEESVKGHIAQTSEGVGGSAQGAS